jgi:hypothetical protein
MHQLDKNAIMYGAFSKSFSKRPFPKVSLSDFASYVLGELYVILKYY